jgi:hypothetical protein
MRIYDVYGKDSDYDDSSYDDNIYSDSYNNNNNNNNNNIGYSDDVCYGNDNIDSDYDMSTSDGGEGGDNN